MEVSDRVWGEGKLPNSARINNYFASWRSSLCSLRHHPSRLEVAAVERLEWTATKPTMKLVSGSVSYWVGGS
jgi:hypothetical protein